MSKPQWTEEQKDVIWLRDRNILVSAAAGSGKTAVLVERIIARISSGESPCDIDKLLVVTFTRAAAAEMRSRIGRALEEKLQEEPENEHIARQASLLHSAQITTIDSFCQWILRNYFHVIDLDPVYRVGDETDLDLMKQSILEELLEEKYLQARETGDPVFLNLTDIFSPGRTDKNIEDLVLSLYEKSVSHPFPEEWLCSLGTMYASDSVEELEASPWMKELMGYLRRCAEEYVKMARQALEVCRESDGPLPYSEAVTADLAFLEELEKADTYSRWYALLEGFEGKRLKAVRGKDADVSPEKQERVKLLRERYLKKGVKELTEKFFFQTPESALEKMRSMREPVDALISLTLEFSEAFRAQKREEQILDFSDMEHLALEILTERREGSVVPSDTARELQGYFEEILTDEYQDSNEVQELILTSLQGRGGEKPHLFMVGDVKQSIYKFRMAKPEIFLQKYHAFSQEEGQDQRIDLCQNFRSRDSVLESVNWIFENIMQESLGGIQYDQAARLAPGMVFEDCDHPAGGKTELLLVEQQSDEVALEKKSLEAAVIGGKIRSLVQGENPLYVKGEHGYRPAVYGDMAILLRSVTGWAEEFVSVLNDMGIPAYADTRTGYFTSLEVKTILNFLHILDNPRQDIPLAAVLRSCLAGFTDEELGWVAAMEEDINYWDQVKAYREEGEKEALREKVSRFLDRYWGYREYAETHSVYELLRKIYQETGYYQYMSAMPSGEKRRANLDILLQQSLEFAGNGHRGIYQFARYIESLQKSEVDFGEASVDGENANAVKIMTIHKSKGLEFPVVFVAGMGKQFNLTDARRGTVIDSEFGLGCDFLDLELRVKQPTLAKRYLANQIVLGTLAEEIRVLYVALTRAKERLFITGSVSQLDRKTAAWLGQGEMDFVSLTTARTYLDWIAPAVLGRPAIREQALSCLNRRILSEEGGAAEDCPVEAEDDLFRWEAACPEETVAAEEEERKKEEALYRELQEMDVEQVYDRKMRESLEEQSRYRYPYQSEAGLPVKISVSELKRQAIARGELLEQQEGTPWEAVCTGAVGEGAEAGVKKAHSGAEGEKKKPEGTEVEVKKAHSGAEGEKKRPEGTKAGADRELPRPAFLQGESELSGAARGTLYHLVMEHFPYRRILEEGRDWSQADFAAYLSEMERAGYMTAQEREALDCRKFQAFLATDIGRRMVRAYQAGTLRLEQPFMMGLPAREIYPGQDSEAMILVQGIIDAFFLQGEEIVLVDYKTDTVKPGQEEELVQKYRAQLDYYARALERLTGKTVSERVIYSFALGRELIVAP